MVVSKHQPHTDRCSDDDDSNDEHDRRSSKHAAKSVRITETNLVSGITRSPTSAEENNMSELDQHLNDLCDRGELDELLAQVTLDTVAATWCRYTERSLAAGSHDLSHEDPDWWAVNFFLCEAFWRDRELRRQGLLALVRATDDELVLSCVGAGPLENFVSDDEEDLQWLEEHASKSESLRIALGDVWADTDVSEATMARLDAAAGKGLARVRADSVASPEFIAAEEARRALFEIAGEDWVSVLVNPTTPEERHAVEQFRQAQARLEDLHSRGPDESTGRRS
jgi:hypothetical protein